MRSHLLYTALGLAFVVGTPAAHAQTVITADIVGPPVGTVIAPQWPIVPAASVVQPPETIQTTTETVRTIRPVPVRPARHQVVTTRTVTRRVVTVRQPLYDAAVPESVQQPVYDEAVPASSDEFYSGTLYDAAPAAVAPAPAIAAPVPAAPMIYRYVYEPDRILVIDPTTNIAVQAIPR